MRVAILAPSMEERRNLRDWITDYSQRRAIPVELVCARDRRRFGADSARTLSGAL